MNQLSVQFQSSGDLLADRRFEWARDCEAKGDFAGAADLLAQALERAPSYASAWFVLGEVREKLGDRAGSVEAFRKAAEADPGDRHGAALHLIRLGASPPRGMPQNYVRGLFDGYASSFDRALQDGLSYSAPTLLRDAVRTARGGRIGSMLDLGCGTGLAGEVFRPLVDWLVGVDLSGGMLAQARCKGLYDRLVEADVLQFLAQEKLSGAPYHVIVAADVFVYLDDLRPVLHAMADVAAPQGLVAFTVETHDGDGVILRDTLRYAHGGTHVREAIAAAGLELMRLDHASTRTEKKQPVPGLLALADRR
ncbi:MAG TPA: methyltransferase [Pseudolabrys sp.]|nr:methyltransferase [Pseudolabrys sp.]